MKAWRFHGFNDMRLDDVPEPACPAGHVLVEPLCVQPSVTEAQLAQGIPTLAYERIKRRLETRLRFGDDLRSGECFLFLVADDTGQRPGCRLAECGRGGKQCNRRDHAAQRDEASHL